MKKIKYLLWDIDGTVLNFLEAEKAAIRKGFREFNLGTCTDEMLSNYSSINKGYWERLERKELTKPEILVGRFRDFFEKYGLDVNMAEEFNSRYQINLGDTICFNDDSFELIRDLNKTFFQYAASNSTALAQHKKLRLSGLDEVFDACFISDEIGHEKPSMGFFEAVFNYISIRHGDFSKDEIMIIGDSLTSDIRGGVNAGIKTCWYNPGGVENNTEAKPDYVITNLGEIREILMD